MTAAITSAPETASSAPPALTTDAARLHAALAAMQLAEQAVAQAVQQMAEPLRTPDRQAAAGAPA